MRSLERDYLLDSNGTKLGTCVPRGDPYAKTGIRYERNANKMALELIEDETPLDKSEREAQGIELEALLARIRWKKSQLADALNCDEKTIRQMARGQRRIPFVVARYLLAIDKFHANHPPPDEDKWRKRWDLIDWEYVDEAPANYRRAA
jgi:hypothetical protein